MKCPKCGCENSDDYRFCKKCGSPREEKIMKIDPTAGGNNSSKKVKIDPISGSKVSKISRKSLILGLLLIVVVAIVAIAVTSLDLGGVQPGNEAIINIDQDEYTSSGKNYCSLSFTLTNAPKEAKTYYVKTTWYNTTGKIISSKSSSLEYESIDDDNTMDIYTAIELPNNAKLGRCVIEISDNQGQLVTSTSYDWINN